MWESSRPQKGSYSVTHALWMAIFFLLYWNCKWGHILTQSSYYQNVLSVQASVCTCVNEYTYKNIHCHRVALEMTKFLFKKVFIQCMCVFGAGCTCHLPWQINGSQRTTWNSLVSPSTTGDQTQIIRLTKKHVYLLCRLAGPRIKFYASHTVFHRCLLCASHSLKP